MTLFALVNGAWVTDEDSADRLVESTNTDGTPAGWTFTEGSDGSVETYDAAGKLQTITDRLGHHQTLIYSDGTAGANGGYVLDAAGNSTTTALPSGLLLRVTDETGRRLSFGYDANNRLVTLIDPAGGLYHYAYDEASSVVLQYQSAGNNLTSVTYPDGSQRRYWYNEQANTSNTNQPNALTGLTDEDGTRYASWLYDHKGRAIANTLAGGVAPYSLVYTTDTSGNPVSTTVTDPLGTQRTYTLQTILGVVKGTGVSQPGGSGCSASSSSVTYDANGNALSRADFNGHQTCYAYDMARNLETTRIEGLASGPCPNPLSSYTPATGTVERKLSTVWHPDWRLETRLAEPKKLTTRVYNGQPDPSNGGAVLTCAPASALLPDGHPIAVLCKQIEQATTDATGAAGLAATVTGAPRITRWTYNALGQALTRTGPRGNLAANDPDYAPATTTYIYYPDTTADHTLGDLASTTDALGHITQVTQYDKNGRPLIVIDPNNVATTLAYKPRGWLESVTTAGETTSYYYDGVGNLKQVTRPDGSYVQYQYDDAHRLTDILDPDGNRIHYTLDGMDNRTKEEIITASNTVAYTHSRDFDVLNRLWHDIGAYHQTSTYEYDAQGNAKVVDGPRSDVTDITHMDYDTLDRLRQVTRPDNGIEQYARDGLDQLATVTDPKTLTTAYTTDGLGNTTKTASPDTGTTNRTYDVAGNPKTETDVRGITVSYTYDALNRVTSKYSDDAGTPSYTYFYDCPPNIGRLCYVLRNGRAELFFNYDPLGRPTAKVQSTAEAEMNILGYAYDAYGRLSRVTYPTNRTVTYGYDARGRVNQVSTQAYGGGSTVLASNFGHAYPFTEPQSWTYGNGTQLWLSLDQDYRTQYRFDGPRAKLSQYDAAGNLQHLNDVSGPHRDYGYDANGRLVSASDTAAGSLGSLAWLYDQNGNRKSETRNGATTSYVYTPSNSNWLYQFGSQYRVGDNRGGGFTLFGTSLGFLAYDGFGQLVRSSNQNTDYEYNALGERMRKSPGGGVTQFIYGPQGELMFEKDNAGHSKAYVWLDDRPIARVDDDSAIYYYHTDHLGTPQVMTDAGRTVVWQADTEPYGRAAVKVATVENNLRLPGQYYDAETGLHYNYFRDYDPATGRYVESDPIGLAGGVNLYAYVGGNPLAYIDPNGLAGVLPGPIPLPIPWPVIPGFPSRNSSGNDSGGLFPDFASKGPGFLFRLPHLPPPQPRDVPNDDPWPSDWKNQCIRLYDRCVNQSWSGNCGACLNKCTAQQEWPFEGPGSCSPKKESCR